MLLHTYTICKWFTYARTSCVWLRLSCFTQQQHCIFNKEEIILYRYEKTKSKTQIYKAQRPIGNLPHSKKPRTTSNKSLWVEQSQSTFYNAQDLPSHCWLGNIFTCSPASIRRVGRWSNRTSFACSSVPMQCLKSKWLRMDSECKFNFSQYALSCTVYLMWSNSVLLDNS